MKQNAVMDMVGQNEQKVLMTRLLIRARWNVQNFQTIMADLLPEIEITYPAKPDALSTPQSLFSYVKNCVVPALEESLCRESDMDIDSFRKMIEDMSNDNVVLLSEGVDIIRPIRREDWLHTTAITSVAVPA